MSYTQGFSVTYETVTPESAEDGEAEDYGFLVESVSFRDAMGALRWYRGSHVEADSYVGSRPHNPRRFSFIGAEENYNTGEITSYSLHLPDYITPASRMRIARLVGCYGAR